MRSGRMLEVTAAILVLLLVTAACGSAGDDFPSRSITLQIPFPAGGPTDTEARIVASHVEEILGESIVPENVEGAGGTVAWDRVPDFATDGHEITLYNLPHIVANPKVRDVRFTTESFDWIAHIGRDPNAVIVRQDSEFETLDDLIEAARENPGGITVGVAGLWLAHHFTVLNLQDAAGIDLTEQPFAGTAPGMTALLGGHVDVFVSNVSDVVRTGDDVRSIAVAAEERSPFLPDVPTFIEQGIDWVISSDRGVAAPAGTDPEALGVLREAFAEALADPELQATFDEVGAAMHVLTTEADIEAYISEVEAQIDQVLAGLDPGLIADEFQERLEEQN